MIATAPPDTARSTADRFVAAHDLFVPDRAKVVRLPHLLGGRLIAPARVPGEVLREELGEAKRAVLGNVQVVRGRDDLLFALPSLSAPLLAVPRPDAVASLRDLSHAEALAFVKAVGAVLPNVVGAEQLCDPERLRAWVDVELAWGGVRGSALLDGWQRPPDDEAGEGLCVRALPTRQLHLPTGDAATPLFTVVRSMALKGAVTIKMPATALSETAALAVAVGVAAPGHPLAEAASIVYWPGGEETLEAELFDADHFDRVVVYGSEETIASVQSRTRGVKVVAFGPRHGASLVGAFPDSELSEVAARAVADSVVADQESCDASIVHFVAGDAERVRRYAEAVRMALARWDADHPRPVSAEQIERFQTVRRGELWPARWLCNGPSQAPTSAVVLAASPPPRWRPPLSRAVLVVGVPRLEEALPMLGRRVGTVGIHPPPARAKLRDDVLARGATSVVPLGKAGSAGAGMPRDGLRPLSEMVTWVTG